MRISKVLPKINLKEDEPQTRGPSPDVRVRNNPTVQTPSGFDPDSKTQYASQQQITSQKQKGQQVLQDPKTKEVYSRAMDLINKLLDASEQARTYMGSFRTKPTAEIIDAIEQSMGHLSGLVKQLPQNESIKLKKAFNNINESIASIGLGNNYSAWRPLEEASIILKFFRNDLEKKIKSS